MSSANKKQRREAKRKAKRREIRRRESISPVKRLADAPGEVEVWMSDGLESDGQMQIFVYKRGAGLTGMAAFLVDRGVVGLKDAWIRMHLETGEFREAIQRSNEQKIQMRRGTADEARRWIAGGLRWAWENGMRLPRDWAKAAPFIGGVGDWQSADVSAFAKEFAGHIEDLRQRLIGEPLESYLQRDDIRFVLNDEAPYMDQQAGEYVDSEGVLTDLSEEELERVIDELPNEKVDEVLEKLRPGAHALAGITQSWLEAQGQAPSDELTEAWTSVLLSRLVAKAAAPDADEDEVADLGFEVLQGMPGRLEKNRVAEHDRAVKQIFQHLETDTDVMQRVGLRYPIGEDIKKAADGEPIGGSKNPSSPRSLKRD